MRCARLERRKRSKLPEAAARQDMVMWIMEEEKEDVRESYSKDDQ